MADVPRYPPGCNAGAEWTVHTILRELGRRGHDPVVHVSDGGSGTRDGVRIVGSLPPDELHDLYLESDVVVTQLGRTRAAVQHALASRRPIVHLVHSHWHLQRHGVAPGEHTLVAFCARWLQEEVNWEGRSIVVRPPVFADDYRTVPGNCTTLLNLSAEKGAHLFFELARRRQRSQFLAVVGGYDEQILPRVMPENVVVFPHTPDVVAVYSRTRVLVVPSSYESWGRVAIEAASSGIPVVAHPTPGLREALGDAGIFCNRDAVEEWLDALDRLDEREEWEWWSAKVQARAVALDPTADLDRLEAELDRLVSSRTYV